MVTCSGHVSSDMGKSVQTIEGRSRALHLQTDFNQSVNMTISSRFVTVKKYVEPQKEGEFHAVEPTDSFVYKGVITNLPSQPVYLSDTQLKVGDVVLFSKYAPDTVEIDLDEGKVKFVKTEDLLAVI